MKDIGAFLKAAGHVKPSARQLAWFDTEMYAFAHFTVNTYTGNEWGDGSEDEAIFNPVNLDCDSWVRELKNAGFRGLILTAKHHDGFCLWPSKYTEHCVKNSPWKDGKGDVVREASDACRRAGLKFGVYLSPWDRNSPYYGTPEYNDYYANQLTELLTGYGELFAIWQDNACGEGPNGKKQVYDFERFNALIRKYQPDAFIFNDFGPDVRWCGNESATVRHAEWSVVPTDLCYRAEKQLDGIGAMPPAGTMYNGGPALGSDSNLLGATGVCFIGAEVDFSIRRGWFYHPEQEPRTAENLFECYLRTVGGNACMHLNVPPMPDGTFDPRDVKVLREFGDLVRREFGSPVPCRYEKTAEDAQGRCIYEIRLERSADIKYVTVREQIAEGQRVERFEIRTGADSAYYGTTIGHKKICPVDLKDTDRIYLVITGTRDTVLLRDITVYEVPKEEDYAAETEIHEG